MQIPFEVDPPSSEKGFTKSPDSEITSNSIASSNDIGQKSISVTKLTNEIKFFLEGKFRSLIVEGELSNLKKATMIVVSSAISKNNLELIASRAKKLPIFL